MPLPDQSDDHATLKRDHLLCAIRATEQILNLDALGRWPGDDRAHFVIYNGDLGVDPKITARVLGVTSERVRQIYQRELRQRKEAADAAS